MVAQRACLPVLVVSFKLGLSVPLSRFFTLSKPFLYVYLKLNALVVGALGFWFPICYVLTGKLLYVTR